MSRLGKARPDSIKLTWRWVVRAASARPSCENPRRPRHSLSRRSKALPSDLAPRPLVNSAVLIARHDIRATNDRQFPPRELSNASAASSIARDQRRAAMLHVLFMGTFSASLAAPVRRHLSIPCEIAVSEEAAVISQLSEADVLVTLVLTREIGRAA